jgi:hypothetical protein
MALRNFKARVRLKTGQYSSVVQAVTVQADNFANARVTLEAQYGKGCVVSPPVETR